MYIGQTLSRMADRFQYIPFDIPDYLAQYFAAKIHATLELESGMRAIRVDRSTYLGKTILRSLEAESAPAIRRRSGKYYLKISNFSGDHHPETPRGTLHFLDVRPETIAAVIEVIKMDFDDALVTFVDGAEFAHAINGWDPRQKRKGIRKAAILEFCNKHAVSPDDKNLQTLFKMCQRRKSISKPHPQKGFRKFCEILSF